jgi:hypothetical protein
MDLISPLHILYGALATAGCMWYFRRGGNARHALLLSLATTLLVGLGKELADAAFGVWRIEAAGTHIRVLGKPDLKDVWYDLAGMALAAGYYIWARRPAVNVPQS